MSYVKDMFSRWRNRKTSSSTEQSSFVVRSVKEDKETLQDLYLLLADYFNLHKKPITKFDIAHLTQLSAHLSYFGNAYVAYDKDKPIGCVVLEYILPRTTRPHGHEISRLFIMPEYRKKNVGLALMRQCAQQLLSHKVPKMFLCVRETDSAFAYYDKLGFTVNVQAQEAGTEGVAYLETNTYDFLAKTKANSVFLK